jgi:hypothetical protein
MARQVAVLASTEAVAPGASVSVVVVAVQGLVGVGGALLELQATIPAAKPATTELRVQDLRDGGFIGWGRGSSGETAEQYTCQPGAPHEASVTSCPRDHADDSYRVVTQR